MLRRRRQPAPFFRLPGAPFNPATGERAPAGVYPVRGTTLALFQVIGDPPHAAADADTHDNYVVCRGYEADHDPHFRYLHDPYTKEDTTPIHVAKPYSVRGTFPYKLGQVIVAARILHRLGYNQGKAATTVGQPADLDEEVELLMDDEGVGISWLDVASPPIPAYDVTHIGGSPGVDVPSLTAMRNLGFRLPSAGRNPPMSGFLSSQPQYSLKVPSDGNYIAHFSGNVEITTVSPSAGQLVVVGFAVAASDTSVVNASDVFEAYSQAKVEYRSGGTILLATNWPMSVTVPLCLRKDEYLQCVNFCALDVKVYQGLFWLQRFDGYKEA